ncbi:MAG: conjugal transfer protein TraX [Coprobacillus sp.]|nr:conjugal transfer protein TraX [Coprobacillus sp.]
MIEIIAIISMLIDHVGYFLGEFYGDVPQLEWVIFAFRLVGRLAMPLFCFGIVQGSIHTKHAGKYMGRLAIVGVIVLAGQLICEYAVGWSIYEGNIFIDLILGVFMIWSLQQKEVWKKCLAIIPFIIGIASYACFAIEYASDYVTTIWWYPYWLRTQYGFLSLLIMAGIYLGYIVTARMMKVNVDEIDHCKIGDSEFHDYARALVNVMSMIFFICAVLIQWIIGIIWPAYDYLNSSFETYCLLDALIILWYNGKEGYHKRWYVVFTYAEYPVTLFLLYAIFTILVMV